MFRRTILPLSSGMKRKTSKKPAWSKQQEELNWSETWTAGTLYYISSTGTFPHQVDDDTDYNINSEEMPLQIWSPWTEFRQYKKHLKSAAKHCLPYITTTMQCIMEETFISLALILFSDCLLFYTARHQKNLSVRTNSMEMTFWRR
jgi:hypothetical protein